MKEWSRLQVHNFILKKREENGVHFVKALTTDGGFSVEFRQDNPMYRLISTVSEDDKEEIGSLAMFLYNIFFVANILDPKMQMNVKTCIGMYVDGAKASGSDISKEEDDKILKEERAAYELRKELERLGNKA